MTRTNARAVTVWLMMLAVVGCAPFAAGGTATPIDSGAASTGTSGGSVSSPPATAPPIVASPTPQPTVLWTCYACSGESVWQLTPGSPHQVNLPRSMGQYYGYDWRTRRILMAEAFGDHGAGPGNVAVSDLSILDLNTGEVQQVLPDNVVEAAWAPDGEAFAYILATAATYELHWRSADGQDSLVASDVSFTWSVAPSGRAVAFSRETGYNLAAAPGLFVVTVPEGKETQLSDADKGGVGSTVDRPAWSPDSQEILFPLWGGPASRLILARADGTRTIDLEPDPGAASEWWAGSQITDALWFPDGDRLLVNTMASSPEEGGLGGMGGPTALVVYRLDRASHLLAEGRPVGETMGLIDWNVPGESFWSIGPGGQPESQSVAPGP